MEKVSKRINAIEEVQNNTKLLNEMLTNYRRRDISDSDRDVMKGLYDRCEKLRPTLFRLAGDTVDNDEALGTESSRVQLQAEILQANDKLTLAVHLYQELVERRDVNGNNGSNHSETKAEILQANDKLTLAVHLYQELVERRDVNGNNGSNHSEMKGMQALSREAFPIGAPQSQGAVKSYHLIDLSELESESNPSTGSRESPQRRAGSPPTSLLDEELTSLVVSPAGGILPVTAYDKNGFRVMLHFARDPPAGRADVLVTVLSMLSTSPLPIRNIVFQAAVPKAVRIKLQTATSSELPAFNPILPPAVISQVMLLTNPQKEKVRLRFKLSFTQGGQSFCELGEVEHFPEISTWTGH
ncbi:UNVERIFIED_CONTAM: hypothetical protein FKN15_033214 [Acipenser sinensis]